MSRARYITIIIIYVLDARVMGVKVRLIFQVSHVRIFGVGDYPPPMPSKSAVGLKANGFLVCVEHMCYNPSA